MSNLQMRNYGSGAVFNIRYTRRMVLLSVDFSFYNEMNLLDAGMSTVLYFNAFFAAVKRICSRYNGEFVSIDGDTCVFGFGRYCGINPELTACRCAVKLRQELSDVMHEILPSEDAYTMIAVHSADVNVAAFNEKNIFRSHSCGPHIALLQQIVNAGNPNQILISQSVYQAISEYADTDYLTDVSTRRIPTTAVYRLNDMIEPHYRKPDLPNAANEVYERLQHLTEQKIPDDRVLILENASANLDDDFFESLYAGTEESMFVYHCVVSEYGRNFYYDILNDFYNITESIMLDNDIPEDKQLLSYIDYLKQVFNFNPTDYKTTVSYQAALYSFVMAVTTLSALRPIVIVVENVDLLDNESVALINHLIVSTKKSQIYYVFTSQTKLDNLDCRMSSYMPVPNMNPDELESYLAGVVSGDSDYMHALSEYVYRITQGERRFVRELLYYLKSHDMMTKFRTADDIPRDIDELIEHHLAGLTDDEADILNVMSLLGAYIEVDFLRYLHQSNAIMETISSLSDKGILRIVRHNQDMAVTFCRSEYSGQIRDELDDETRGELHRRIAEAYTAAYQHNLPKFYEKLAYHYQNADMLDMAVYYVFCTAVNYREQKENAKARDLLLSAIVLGKEIQDEEDELHYFTDRYVRMFDYINHQIFGKQKRTLRLSLDVMYYYYAKTFELIDAEASVYLLKAYHLSKQFHNDFITVASAIHYFIYNCYTTKESRYEYLEEATQLARNNHDVFMELYAQIAYIDVIFAECRDRTQNEPMVMSHFYNAKNGIKTGSAYMSLAGVKTINVMYYTNLAYYLKHKDADIGRIIRTVHKVESYLTSDIDRVGFYRSIATGFGPLVGTPYQLIYTRKNLNLAKRQKHIPMVAQFKATVGYLYMLEGQYKKALHYHQSAKEISRKTNDIHEIHMAYKNLGDLCNCLERYADAMKFYRKCLETPIRYDDSHKHYVDFSDPVFPKSALAFTLIKTNRLDEAAKYIKEVELSMSNIFFGNEIPIFLVFLRCYLSLILEEYDDETIKIMKNCYCDMKQLNPGAVQLVWMKRELTENGIDVD